MTDVLYLTPQELADRWRMSRQRLAEWRVLGSGPRYIKFGTGPAARVLYPLSEVERYENKHLRASVSVASPGGV